MCGGGSGNVDGWCDVVSTVEGERGGKGGGGGYILLLSEQRSGEPSKRGGGPEGKEEMEMERMKERKRRATMHHCD